jgi:hypothetical protein
MRQGDLVAGAQSADWQPLRTKLVVEVRCDHATGNRFRRGTGLVRWRPDKAPAQCTFEQLPRLCQRSGCDRLGDGSPERNGDWAMSKAFTRETIQTNKEICCLSASSRLTPIWSRPTDGPRSRMPLHGSVKRPLPESTVVFDHGPRRPHQSPFFSGCSSSRCVTPSACANS